MLVRKFQYNRPKLGNYAEWFHTISSNAEEVIRVIHNFMEAIIVILFIVLAILGYQIYSLSIKVEQKAKEKYESWKKNEYEYIKREQRELASREARSLVSEEVNTKVKDQFEGWQKSEIERIKNEQRDIAKQEAEILFNQWKESNSKQIRSDAIQKSKAVIAGKITEHFVPFLPDFNFNPKDARFMGSPIDLIVFDGLDDETLRDIWFIEVKTGASALSKRQRQIRDAVQGQRVKWLEIKKDFS